MSAAAEDWDAFEVESEPSEDGGRAPLHDYPRDLARGLALGYLAMLPLILAYELGARSAGGLRSAAEMTLVRPLAPLGEWADAARFALYGGLAAWALVHCVRRHWALGPRVLRIVLEGAVGAVVIGPLLILVLSSIGELPPLQLASLEFAPSPSRVAFVCGAAAHEELLFRVGLYSCVYVLALRVARFFGLGGMGGRLGAEGAALLTSSAVFAASHLTVAIAWLGAGGEPFDAAVFTWRLGAGVVLGLLFRLRGVGVAAWTHAFFNLALLLGAGPEVFL